MVVARLYNIFLISIHPIEIVALMIRIILLICFFYYRFRKVIYPPTESHTQDEAGKKYNYIFLHNYFSI